MRVIQPVGTLCEEKPRADKNTREPSQKQVCQGDRAGISHCEGFQRDRHA